MQATKTAKQAVAAKNGHTWAELPRAKRQQLIKRFCATNNIDLARRFVDLVRAPQGYGVYASAGVNYHYAVFGRDSIQLAEDVLLTFPALSLEIILLLARLQGVANNTITEEEPGKVHHEFRSRYFNNQLIPPSSLQIYEYLAAIRGGQGDELCYYGSVDATPLFVCLVRSYCQLYGDDILQQKVTRRDGKVVTLLDSVRAAVDWVATQVSGSEWNLLEFKRQNPEGLPFQAWKDSETGYLHTDGHAANADGGIASVEVQGFAFDALYAGAEMTAQNAEERRKLQTIAHALRDATLKHMWLPDQQFFAVGLDRDESGSMRRIATMTTNAGQLLRSDMWTTLDPDVAKTYVDPVVKRLMGEEFLTDAGLRGRSLIYGNLMPFADYHGSYVTWPRDTYTVALGLVKQGYTVEAADLEDRILQTVAKAGEFYEFFFVTKDGQVKYHYRVEDPNETTLASFGLTNRTEPGQAWTISSVISCIAQRVVVQTAQIQ